jgi:hypothetical protein
VTRFTVSVLPEAEADIREAFLWYRERSLLAGDGFRSEVFEAIDDLAESGGVWQGRDCPTRSRAVNFEVR